jgi:hypothetical protein
MKVTSPKQPVGGKKLGWMRILPVLICSIGLICSPFAIGCSDTKPSGPTMPDNPAPAPPKDIKTRDFGGPPAGAPSDNPPATK